MNRAMTLADESRCVRTATRLPGLFGPLTPGEFVERYGVPSDAQAKRLERFIVICNDGFVRPRSPSEVAA